MLQRRLIILLLIAGLLGMHPPMAADVSHVICGDSAAGVAQSLPDIPDLSAGGDRSFDDCNHCPFCTGGGFQQTAAVDRFTPLGLGAPRAVAAHAEQPHWLLAAPAWSPPVRAPPFPHA